jgi:mono/diheme cytochrome c family protein
MKGTRLTRLLVATLSGMLLFATFLPQGACGEDTPATEGKGIFQSKCSPCHTIGGGRLVGPDLKGVTAVRNHAWLTSFISTPDRVFASGDQIANRLLKEYGGVAMPNLGLSQAQVDELVAYLAESAPQKKSVPPVATTIAAAGDLQRGAALFTGVIPFQRGGAPCMACHTVSGVAPLGGGSLGPDLTRIHGRLGETGLASLLATLPFPTMRPIYQSRPLTQAERDDLAALFRVAAGRRPVYTTPRITALAVAGCVALLLLAGVVWRKRLRSVRRKFVTAMIETGGEQR